MASGKVLSTSGSTLNSDLGPGIAVADAQLAGLEGLHEGPFRQGRRSHGGHGRRF